MLFNFFQNTKFLELQRQMEVVVSHTAAQVAKKESLIPLDTPPTTLVRQIVPIYLLLHLTSKLPWSLTTSKSEQIVLIPLLVLMGK